MTTHVNRSIRAIAALALAASVAGSASCSSMVRGSNSNSYLIIDSLQGFANDDSTGTNLQSDVLTKGGILEDEGRVVFRLGLKDPGAASAPASPTSNNFITVNRYRVVFTRTDGRNVPGVDVPFPFESAFTVTVRGEGTTEAAFSLVRVQAKGEPPLRNLAGGFGLGVISTIAEITFHGHDQTGRAVTVTGRIAVDFADFADPD